MVEQHYRWDFIGLSTDVKPTPSTSEKVVNGSTFYCSDNSKLYVWYKTQWYEKTATGGGGTSYTAGDGITITDDTISVDTTTIQPKLTAGTNISIDENNEISATDTTYSNFTGTDGTSAGTAGLVPAPTTTDTDKYLKSDGTWATAGGGGGDTIYSDKNTSNKNAGGAVYIGNLNSSQEEQPDPTTTDSHYRYFWALPNANSHVPSNNSINILGSQPAYPNANTNITIGKESTIQNGARWSVAIGANATIDGTHNDNVAIGSYAQMGLSNYSVSLGAYSSAGRDGEINVGTGSRTYGFNSTSYRVIGGVHDGQNNHDCATVAQGNTLATSAPTTATEGVLGQLYTDTTNMHTYQCTAIDTTDPDNPSYTWVQRW